MYKSNLIKSAGFIFGITLFASSGHATLIVSDLEQCIHNCQSFHFNQIVELARCEYQCHQDYGYLSSKNKMMCETFEPGCERTGDGDEDGQNDNEIGPPKK